MSDDELSDDMNELNDLIAEYRSKEQEEGKVDVDQKIIHEDEVDGDHEIIHKDEEDEVDGDHEIILKDEEGEVDVDQGAVMDRILFGDKAKLIRNLENAVSDSSKRDNIIKSGEETNKVESVERKAKKRKPVWVDPDDEDIQLGEIKRETKRTGSLDHLKKDKSYKEYLTARFTRIVNQPKWASFSEKDKKETDEDDEILRTVGFLKKPSDHILNSGHLKMKRLKDLNRSTYAEGVVNNIEFHPTSTAALVAGSNGVATIYAVDGTENDKLHNIHIDKFPIKCARLLPCGTKAIFGSSRPYAYLYDLITAKETRFNIFKDMGNLAKFKISPCGRYLVSSAYGGRINIFGAKTFEVIRTLKQNDEVASICFTSDSNRLIVSGQSSNVCIFSMRQQRIEHKFVDDGCIVGNAMDLSANQRLLATGSREGVVNVYDFEKLFLSTTPLPDKTLLNLRTGISCVRFNHSSELLAFSSMCCKDAVKMAHFPSGTVYANFPGTMPKLGYVRTLSFSPQSAYFALGTQNMCPLFRIKHFQNY